MRIGTVWDRTVDVLQGRAAILSGIAAAYLFLPNLFSGALGAYAGTEGSALVLLVNIAVIVLLVMGVLAISAVASDPAVTRADATGTAMRRLGPAIAVLVVMIAVATLAFLPLGALLFAAGASVDSATGQVDITRADPARMGMAALLMIALGIVGLWVSARLVPLFAVVVNERAGIRAFGRSLALTRGAGLRLMGVILLYGIVLVVVMAAASSVVGVIARLLLGGDADATVTFLVSIATAIVTAIATVVQTVFYTQFYVAARAGERPPQPLA